MLDINRALTQVAVVIPYYQRKGGLLAAALESVFRQTALDRSVEVSVVVIDDYSPRSPQLDIQLIEVPEGVTVTVIKTPANAGPAVARNCGLDAVSRDTDFVAFLDSDEVWAEQHIENAIIALDTANADLYFSNHQRDVHERDKFSITGFGKGHSTISAERDLFNCSGDMLVDVLIKATVRIQTCVVRWDKLHSLRFESGLMIGEDSDYVAKAIVKFGCQLCFCANVETREERPGVNISQNPNEEPSKECEIRLRMLAYQVHVLQHYGKLSGLGPQAREALNEARYNVFSAAFKPTLKTRKRMSVFFKAFGMDPLYLTWCTSFVLQSLFRRLFTRIRIQNK